MSGWPKVPELVMVKKPHDRSIDEEVSGYHEWVFLKYVARDSRGYRTKRAGVIPVWQLWSCSNADCSAEAIVSNQAIQSLIEGNGGNWW